MSAYLETRPSAASMYEASGRTGALSAAIKPLATGWRVWGHAFTVQETPGNNVWIHRAISEAAPGEILVVATGATEASAYWGEVCTNSALARHLGGVVLDGWARDAPAVLGLGFPIFSRGLCLLGPGKDPQGGGLGIPIQVGGVDIKPGDLIVGDADGVVAVRRDRTDQVIALAMDRENSERTLIERLYQGRTSAEER